ncbi:riboflavin synthase [Sediminibacterium soli]|uniref:riboflavin synthase n=1 Tax=Sediminibacterium soli TaxID=2698829 RepID=UPI001379F60B|nr:riboflavin synthase [Sediminibacterium soli]NCI48207.1 riboflavin synthase [Sediminibacterium soli]
MFTGIIECVGKILWVEENGTNRSFWVESAVSDQLKIDQSVSHQGVCLTVEAVENGRHRVTAIAETLRKTDLVTWAEGRQVNIERCMLMNGRLDGHIVQGHVDTTAVCTGREEREGSWEFCFEFPPDFAALVIEKGSVAVNGTSLTCFNIGPNRFSVAIIPYTYEHTSISQVKTGDTVNIEFDILGKYISRQMELGQTR